MHSESFTCPNPDCGKTSYHPEDIREGYCGNCCWWTGHPSIVRIEADAQE